MKKKKVLPKMAVLISEGWELERWLVVESLVKKSSLENRHTHTNIHTNPLEV